jgi:hypothetical protein
MALATAAACNVCASTEVAVWCDKCHAYCQACFDHTVRCQVLGEGRLTFVQSGCKVCCPFCPLDQSPPSFTMRKCAPWLDQSTFDAFHECLLEQAVLQERRSAEIHFAKKIQEIKQSHASQQQQQDDEVAEHAAHIVDKLIGPSCPNCGAYVADFDACSALQCSHCSVYFCAWCLVLVEEGEGKTARTRCHSHVREDCLFNPWHNVFPPAPHPETWRTVMHELGRKRVKDYIQNSGGV